MATTAATIGLQPVSALVGSLSIFRAYAGVKQLATQIVTMAGGTLNAFALWTLSYPEAVFTYDASETSYTDYTTEAASDTDDDVKFQETDPAFSGDIFYVGNDYKFEQVTFKVTTAQAEDPNADGVWEYYNGSWVTLTLLDNELFDQGNTIGKKQIVFSDPGDWAKVNINGTTAYYVRFRFTGAFNPTPQWLFGTVQVRQFEIPYPATGVYPASVVYFTRFNRWTRVSVGWATMVQREIQGFQQDYASACGSFDTLASRIAVMRTSQGTWKSDGLTHGMFTFGASEHHARLHFSAHKTGASDGIPLSSVGGAGYLSMTNHAKAASMASGSTRNPMTNFIYTGGGSYQRFTMGFTPQRVIVMRDDASTYLPAVFRWTRSYGMQDMREINGSFHTRQWGATNVAISGTNLLHIENNANLNGRVYRAIVWGY